MAEGHPDEPLERAQTVRASGPSEDSRLARGDAVGRYVILDHLASGGMGAVYRAYDPELDRAIAIKLVRPYGPIELTSTTARGRLLREAQALARVQHPNVIAVYDVGAVGRDVFIAMELVDGQTLREWLRAERRDATRIVEVLLEAARALAAAHAAGVIHRDFKPDNVLVGRDGRARVVDFGLAYALEQEMIAAELDEKSSSGAGLRRELDSLQLTRTGQQLGTPQYMAPEQHRRTTVDARADQFAFCATAYEALYRERPFSGRTYADLATAKQVGEIRPPPRDADVPATLRDAILRGLAADPDDRHASMKELIEQLAPRRTTTGRRWAWTGAAAVAAAALAWWLAPWSSGSQTTCTGASDRLASAWGPDVRAAVERSFIASGRPYAADAFRRFAAIADQHSNAWIAMRTDVCEATRVRGEQSAHLMDLRMSCLDRRLAELAALTGALAGGVDGDAVDRSIEAASRLPALGRCADTEALLETIPPPADEATRSELERVRTMIDEALALDGLGRLEEALAVAQRATVAATELAYPLVQAEALSMRASLEAQTGAPEAAEASYVEAARLAAGAGDRTLAAESLVSLIWVVGHEQARLAEAHAYANAAHVAVGSAGDEWTHAMYSSYRAVLLEAEGQYEPALAALNEAETIYRRLLPPNDLRLARLYNELGGIQRAMGMDEEAYAAYRNALSIRQRAQGAGHPDVGIALNNMSIVCRQDGKLTDAVQYAEQALAILEVALGAEHVHVSRALHSLALARAAQGEHAQASQYFQRALSIAEQRLGEQHPDVADLLNSAGFSLRALNRHDAAQGHHRRALAIYRETLPPDHPRVADTLVSLGLALTSAGQLDEAKLRYDEALAIYERTLGPSHPAVAILLVNLGELALMGGARGEALEHCQRALDIDRANLGEEHPDLSYAMLCIGRARLGSSDAKQVVALLERTVELRERAAVDPLLIAEARFELARALWAARADRSRARHLAHQAADAYAGDRDKYREITTWMQKHGLVATPSSP